MLLQEFNLKYLTFSKRIYNIKSDKLNKDRPEVKFMDIKEILSKVDHTVLSQNATWDDIKSLCDDGIKYGCASVCIAPCFVKKAKEYVGNSLKICTVIGFPNGYNTTAVKAFEAAEAVKNGADEIDMVINIGMLKEKRYDDILCEINTVKNACDG